MISLIGYLTQSGHIRYGAPNEFCRLFIHECLYVYIYMCMHTHLHTLIIKEKESINLRGNWDHERACRERTLKELKGKNVRRRIKRKF